MTDNRRRFLRRIRARMRLAWFVATAQRFAPFVALAVLIALVVSSLTPFDHGLIAGGAILGVFLLVLALAALLLRISDWDAARAAERGLGARDAFTSALEFDHDDDSVHQLIQDKAESLAVASQPARAIPIRPDKTRLRQLALVGSMALAFAILPPLGSTPALSSDARTAIQAEADRVEELAEAVEEADVETSEEIVEELERLVEELRQAETLEQALESLEDAETRLGGQIDPQFLAQKAAVQGLARDLALRPLTNGSSLDAADQLEELAETLDSLSEPELAALGDRLADLAASQAAGNPSLSGQLSEASRAVGEGDLSAASQSLRQAAAGQSSGLTGARGQQALSETQRALESARFRLSDTAAPGLDQANLSGDGQSQGQGQGQGQGTGTGPRTRPGTGTRRSSPDRWGLGCDLRRRPRRRERIRPRGSRDSGTAHRGGLRIGGGNGRGVRSGSTRQRV